MCLTEANTRLWYSVWGKNCFCAIVCIRWSNCAGDRTVRALITDWSWPPLFDSLQEVQPLYVCNYELATNYSRTSDNRWGNGTEDESVFCGELQSWRQNYSGVPFARSTLQYFLLIDRCVIARDALGRPPTAVATAVSVDGLKLSTWIVWPTWRTWWIREVDMVNQWSWLRYPALWAALAIAIEAELQAMSHAHKPADTVCVCVCAHAYIFVLCICVCPIQGFEKEN